ISLKIFLSVTACHLASIATPNSGGAMENLGDYRARLLVVLAMLISVDLIDGARTYAVANDNDGGFRAVPAVFVGTAPGCAPSPPGSNIVTSAWLPGMGLPDNGTSNITSSSPPKRDPHRGLLISKDGATADCSSALARILRFGGLLVTANFHLGLADRDGGHQDEDVDWKSMDVAPGQTADMPVDADANGLSIGGALDDGQLVVLEIYNPAGLLVGTSLPAVGRVMVSVPVTLAGNYTLRAR